MKFLSTLLLLISLIAYATASFSTFNFGCEQKSTLHLNECGNLCGSPAKISVTNAAVTDAAFTVNYYTDNTCSTTKDIPLPLVCGENGQGAPFGQSIPFISVECSSATTVFASVVLIAASLLFLLF